MGNFTLGVIVKVMTAHRDTLIFSLQRLKAAIRDGLNSTVVIDFRSTRRSFANNLR